MIGAEADATGAGATLGSSRPSSCRPGAAGLSQTKIVASLQAMAALRGAVLDEITDDAGRRTWILTLDAHTATFADIVQLEQAVARLGALA